MQQRQHRQSDVNRARKSFRPRGIHARVRRATLATIEQLESRWLLNSIGLNFVGGDEFAPGGTIGPTESAGSFDATYNPGGVIQSNWNNLAGVRGVQGGLKDSTGATLTTSVTWNSAGTWSASQNPPQGGDEELNTGFLMSNGTGTPISVTIDQIPYQQYDVYIYTMNDAPRDNTTTAYGVSYYGISPDPRGIVNAGVRGNERFLDDNPSTPYAYIPSTSRNQAAPSSNGDVVVFHLQGGSTFSFATVSPGNGYANGVQIVDTSTDRSTMPAGLPRSQQRWKARRRRHQHEDRCQRPVQLPCAGGEVHRAGSREAWVQADRARREFVCGQSWKRTSSLRKELR